MLKIIPATQEHLHELISLFDLYRMFYKQVSNKEGAKIFLENRIKNNESVIFLAFYNEKPVGFTQLFTTFSSVSLSSVFILNDLYVDREYRKKGVGEALLNKAKECCIEKGYKGLALETGTENPAQQLYEKLGWQKDYECFHYFWTAPKM